MSIPAEVVARLKAALGSRGFVDDPHAIAPHLLEPRRLFRGEAPFLLSPASTAEVAAVVRICAEAHLPMVPQGGNTGLVGGQIPGAGEVLISLARLNAIRAVDADNDTLTAEAGCILADVQARAEAADRLFPLSLAAEGSCTIGGNLSTNAGGTQVLRYGMARDLVLGLEVVLPDGRVFEGLRGLRKDNTGYDLKQIFLGAEGTLGIITAAVLKLFPRHRAVETAFAALPTPDAALGLFRRLRATCGETLNAFELVPRIGLDLVLRHMRRPDTRDPFSTAHPWYALVELGASEAGPMMRERLEEVLGRAVAEGIVADAVLASDLAQARALWHLREGLSEAQRHEGGSIKCDVAVPVSAVPAFIAAATRAVALACPEARPVPFGHLGDGNIHFNLSVPSGGDSLAFLARWDELSTIVHDIADSFGGSFSAEHGLGRLKRDESVRRKSALEIEMMRALKRAFDPQGLMNPGKLVELVAQS